MVFRFISDSVLSSLDEGTVPFIKLQLCSWKEQLSSSFSVDEVTVPQIKNSNSNGHLVYVCALGGRVRQPHTLPLVSMDRTNPDTNLIEILIWILIQISIWISSVHTCPPKNTTAVAVVVMSRREAESLF